MRIFAVATTLVLTSEVKKLSALVPSSSHSFQITSRNPSFLLVQSVPFYLWEDATEEEKLIAEEILQKTMIDRTDFGKVSYEDSDDDDDDDDTTLSIGISNLGNRFHDNHAQQHIPENHPKEAHGATGNTMKDNSIPFYLHEPSPEPHTLLSSMTKEVENNEKLHIQTVTAMNNNIKSSRGSAEDTLSTQSVSIEYDSIPKDTEHGNSNHDQQNSINTSPLVVSSTKDDLLRANAIQSNHATNHSLSSTTDDCNEKEQTGDLSSHQIIKQHSTDVTFDIEALKRELGVVSNSDMEQPLLEEENLVRSNDDAVSHEESASPLSHISSNLESLRVVASNPFQETSEEWNKVQVFLTALGNVARDGATSMLQEVGYGLKWQAVQSMVGSLSIEDKARLIEILQQSILDETSKKDVDGTVEISKRTAMQSSMEVSVDDDLYRLYESIQRKRLGEKNRPSIEETSCQLSTTTPTMSQDEMVKEWERHLERNQFSASKEYDFQI